MAAPAAPLPNLSLHEGTDRDSVSPVEITRSWFNTLETKASSGKLDDISDLFISDCWWRDFVGLSWDIRTKHGLDEISRYLQSRTVQSGVTHFELIEDGVFQPRLSDLGGFIWIESGFTFQTNTSQGRGILRLASAGPSEWKAWCVATVLEGLKGFKETPPQEKEEEPVPQDLQVLIIGAGHSGLSLAARLKAMNVKTLVVDKSSQVGSSWRARYRSITAHTPKYSDHYPYLKFPEEYPKLPKQDDILKWMEHYQEALGLEVELGVNVRSVDYDASSRKYAVKADLSDGREMILHPHHVVLATGLLSDIPSLPSFDNQETFKGQIYHSGEYKQANLIDGLEKKKIVLVGAGTSSHDIAQELVNSGAGDVTMIQRSPMFVFTLEAEEKLLLAPWQMMGTEDADLAGNSFPFPVAFTMALGLTSMVVQHDEDLLKRLEKAGMAIKRGENGEGLLHDQLLKFGHFYIDQGACEMIIDGRIKVRQHQDGAKGFYDHGVILGDGSKIEADLVILATGFETAPRAAEDIMGKEFLAKVGTMGKFDDEGELSGWWRPTGAPGFWYMTGNFSLSRFMSRLVALQIKAVEEGLNKEYYL